MNRKLVDEIAAAVLYEGYLLYPYRPSALKNQQRFNFGVVSPHPDGEPGGGFIHTECLVHAAGGCDLEVSVRFLHLTTRTVEFADAGTESRAWQEAIERDVTVHARLDDLCAAPIRLPFSCPAGQEVEPRDYTHIASAVIRSRERVDGEVELSACRSAPGVFKVAVRIANLTPIPAVSSGRETVLRRSLVSSHAVLHVAGGEFVSLLDPPEHLHALASTCRNVGVWPVLVGEDSERDAVLASPIILYDHPRIAPESAGDFFDGTEIDEMLVLRILTMTDDEKREMRAGDPRARQMLDRTEGLPEDHLMKLHGALRALRPSDEGGAR